MLRLRSQFVFGAFLCSRRPVITVHQIAHRDRAVLANSQTHQTWLAVRKEGCAIAVGNGRGGTLATWPCGIAWRRAYRNGGSADPSCATACIFTPLMPSNLGPWRRLSQHSCLGLITQLKAPVGTYSPPEHVPQEPFDRSPGFTPVFAGHTAPFPPDSCEPH